MADTVHQAREALGQRLREIRRDSGLSGRSLAELAGWHSSKVSKIEHGKQTPSEEDIRAWCQQSGAADQIPDLIATARNIEAMYVEWRRMLHTGTRRRQQAARHFDAATCIMRWYEPVLIPGILHTVEYATAVLQRVVAFYEIPDDIDAGVGERIERQHALYRGDRRFHFIIAYQSLYTVVGNISITIGQLDRLLRVITLPRVRLGIMPAHAEYQVPSNQFVMFDNRLVQVESISAELSITQPREIALYGKAFNELAKQAVYGDVARLLITKAISSLSAAG